MIGLTQEWRLFAWNCRSRREMLIADRDGVRRSW